MKPEKSSSPSGPKPPEIDLSNLWADDEHEVKRKQEQYARDMAAYVKAQILSELTLQKPGTAARLKKFFSKKSVIAVTVTIVIAAIICITTGIVSFRAGCRIGYADYEKLYNFEHDPMRQVYFTTLGDKYHYEDCPTIANSTSVQHCILEYALDRNLQPCAVCHEGRR